MSCPATRKEVTRWGAYTQRISLSHKKDDTMSCPATRKEVEMIIQSEVK